MSKILKNKPILRQIVKMFSDESGTGRPGAAGGSIKSAGG